MLPDLQQLYFYLRASGGSILLQKQVHGGDRGLDLVDPKGVVIRQLPEAVFVFRREFGPVLAHSPQQGLVILLKQASGRRQRQFFFPRPPQKAPQLPVPGKKPAIAHGKENQSKH